MVASFNRCSWLNYPQFLTSVAKRVILLFEWRAVLYFYRPFRWWFRSLVIPCITILMLKLAFLVASVNLLVNESSASMACRSSNNRIKSDHLQRGLFTLTLRFITQTIHAVNGSLCTALECGSNISKFFQILNFHIPTHFPFLKIYLIIYVDKKIEI